jgi:adenylate cyclase
VGLKQELEANVDAIIRTPWDRRDGREIPESDDRVKFIHDAVELDATFLYADLRDSTSLAQKDRHLASEVFQAFLSTTARVILAENGAIRSFDGDRVMAVFIGNDKNSRATRCALKIHYAFREIVKPKLEAAYAPKLAPYVLGYSAGLDTGKMWAVRGGVRDNSDLIWVGRAPNLAAKLSALRDASYPTWITGTVYDMLSKESKLSDGKDMWEERVWKAQGNIRIYRSSYWWRFA